MIDLIMPVHNNFLYTYEAVESIRQNTSMPYRIILVDNGSVDETRSFKAQNIRDDFIYIRNDFNQTFAEAVNQGLKKSTAEYIGILNNDIKVPKHCFERLILHLTKSEKSKTKRKIGLIGPLQSDGNEERPSLTSIYRVRQNKRFKKYKVALGPINKKWNLKVMNDYLEKVLPNVSHKLVKCMPFFCVVMKRHIFEKIGYLDEEFINGGEDEDYCRRLEAIGYDFHIAMDVAVKHYTHKSIDKLPVEWPFSLYTQWNMEMLYRKFPDFYLKQGYQPRPEMLRPSVDILRIKLYSGEWEVQLNVICDHCGKKVDILQSQTFKDNHRKYPFGKEFRNVDLNFKCPECSQMLKVKEINSKWNNNTNRL